MTLLVVMIYVIALFRASLNVEKVRQYLANKHRLFGYVAGSFWRGDTILLLFQHSHFPRFYQCRHSPRDHDGIFDHVATH
ncbi:hypothetical protein P4S72_29420 [Vibrio sp. PP-XX7]